MSTDKAKIIPIKDEAREILTQDSLENLIANLGTEGDKRSASKIVNRKRLSLKGNEQELTDLYRTDWVSGKVVDIIPNDMTREWRTFTSDDDPEIIQVLIDEEKRLGTKQAFNRGHKWSRLYGTSFIVMDIDDGQTADKPLRIDQIRPGGLRHIKVIDRNRINIKDQQPIANPLDPNYGMPEFYRFVETNTVIHHSRMIRFDAIELPFDEFRRNHYFSDSVLDRIYESIINFMTATESSASMIYESNVDVMKVKGLMTYLQTADGESMIRKRFALAKLLKSFNNMTLLDSEEEHEHKSTSFAGLPDLIDRFAKMLAAATDIPATRFLGTSASGLNATGEGDLKNYYDTIASLQTLEYEPKLDYFDQIMAASLQLDLPKDTEITYIFNPLFQISPEQQATIDLNNAQRDQIYYDMDVVSTSMIAKELKQKGTYTNITDEDIEEMEEFEDLDDDDFSTDPAAGLNETKSEDEDGKEETSEGGEDS